MLPCQKTGKKYLCDIMRLSAILILAMVEFRFFQDVVLFNESCEFLVYD